MILLQIKIACNVHAEKNVMHFINSDPGAKQPNIYQADFAATEFASYGGLSVLGTTLESLESMLPPLHDSRRRRSFPGSFGVFRICRSRRHLLILDAADTAADTAGAAATFCPVIVLACQFAFGKSPEQGDVGIDEKDTKQCRHPPKEQ
mmetsp:Transcript_13717/g.28300  ORF Transcript_13717/g.28300 Transcript_13717/m.28300 type:complete len:149 (-) Transcript_13717:970-1416(-)